MQVSPPDSYNDGTCNADLPNDSAYTRFLYVIRYLTRNNFYVVIDNQVNTDSTITDNPDVSPRVKTSSLSHTRSPCSLCSRGGYCGAEAACPLSLCHLQQSE